MNMRKKALLAAAPLLVAAIAALFIGTAWGSREGTDGGELDGPDFIVREHDEGTESIISMQHYRVARGSLVDAHVDGWNCTAVASTVNGPEQAAWVCFPATGASGADLSRTAELDGHPGESVTMRIVGGLQHAAYDLTIDWRR